MNASANICLLCLTEVKQSGELLNNWVDVLLKYGLEVFPDDGLPQQICLNCTNTLTIATKLEDPANKTNILLNYHEVDIKPYLKNDKSTIYSSNNAINELNETAIVKVKYEMDDSVDVKFNYPALNDLATSMDIVTMNNRPIIKSETRIMLEKLPDHVSNTSLIYCSICLSAFTDSEQFRIHLYFNIHNTNKCISCCVKYENVTQLWKHIKSVHADDILNAENNSKNIENDRRRQTDEVKMEHSNILTFAVEKQLKYHTNMTEEQLSKQAENLCINNAKKRLHKYVENQRKQYANMSEKQKKKQAEYKRQELLKHNRKWYAKNMKKEQREKSVYAKLTEEQRKKRAENRRKRYASMSEEQRKKILEYSHKQLTSMTEEQRKKRLEYRRKMYANMTEEQRKKIFEYNHKRNASMTAEQRKKISENTRKKYARMTEERRKKILEYCQKRKANITEEQRKKILENRRKKYASMTEEQRKIMSENRRKKYASLTEEQMKKRKEKRAEYERKRRDKLKQNRKPKHFSYAEKIKALKLGITLE